MDDNKKCGNCSHYEPKTEYVGECFKINQYVLIENPIPEAQDFTSANQLLVRKEFGCNLHEG